jgi:hypothetical protein
MSLEYCLTLLTSFSEATLSGSEVSGRHRYDGNIDDGGEEGASCASQDI